MCLYKGPFQPMIRKIENCPVSSEDSIHFTLRDMSTRETYMKGPTYDINATFRTPIVKSLAVSITYI